MSIEKLGPYRLDKVLGRGGMGTVYLGVNEETDERRAIKLLADNFAQDHDFRERFLAEIETLKTLSHPNIVELTGYGEQDGHLFYAMEVIEGPSLQDELVRGRKFTWEEVTDYTIQICGALKHAHDHGVIHRDLKPANLLLARDEHVKLTDFGIAKLFGGTNITAAGGVLGTADYMAPEQAEGKPATPRTDLYSLGSVMYALLSRRPPFMGKTLVEVLQKLRFEPPPPIRAVGIDVPDELRQIIEELLAKDPSDRIPTSVVLTKRLQAMKYGLAAAGNEDKEDDAGFEEGPRSSKTITSQDDRPTIVLDAPDIGRPDRHFDETVVSSVDSAPTPTATPETPTARPTHYTTVDAERRQVPGVPEEAELPAGKLTHHLSTFGMIGALVLIAAGFWYATRPPSADQLYRKIETVAAAGEADQLLDVHDAMDRFLTRFPEDDRARQVRLWQRDHEAYRLWRQLERAARKVGGPKFLAPLYEQYVLAYRQIQKDAGEALAGFQAIAANPPSDEAPEPAPPSEADDVQRAQVLESVEHMIDRLGDSPADPAAS